MLIFINIKQTINIINKRLMSKNFRTSEIIPKNSDLLNNALKIIIIQITFEFLIKNVETKNGFINIIDINKNRQIL